MYTIQQIKDYLNQAKKGFKKDPADTDYQRGYEAAIDEMIKEFSINKKQHLHD